MPCGPSATGYASWQQTASCRGSLGVRSKASRVDSDASDMCEYQPQSKTTVIGAALQAGKMAQGEWMHFEFQVYEEG